MDAVSLKLARNYTNEKLNNLPSNAPTKTLTFDGGIYSVGNDVVNGQVSDIKLLGNTIFNYADNGNNYSKWTVDSGSSKSSNGISLVGKGGAEYAGLPIQLRPSTQYTIVYNVTAKTSSGIFAIAVNSLISGMYDQEITSNIGINKARITTKDTITDDNLRFKIAGGNDGDYINFQVWAILEGDWTNRELPFSGEIGYGTKSTNSVRVKSVGKNLFDGELELGSYTAGVKIDGTTSIRSVDRIKIKPNTTYKFSSDLDYTFIVQEFDKNGNFIKQQSAGLTLYTSDINAEYWVFRTASGMSNLNVKVQLETGTTATPYEPYKESSVIINLPEPLRSLPNGVKDEVRVSGGNSEVFKRTKEKILQASDIQTSVQYVDNGIVVRYFVVEPSDMKDRGIAGLNNLTVGNIPVGLFEDRTTTNIIGKFYTDTVSNIVFGFETGTTLEQARTELSGLTLTYQLATPIVTKLPAQAPLQVFENGTVYVEPIGDPAESTVPSVEMTIPTGTSNKFGVATHDYGGDTADWTLTKNEANCGILIVTNAGGAANIIVPNDLGRFFFVKNDSGYDVVVKSAGAEAGTTIADGNSVIVFNTGD